jgi:hypothetical protein
VRRRLKPTHAERAVFGEDDGSDIQVHDTDVGWLDVPVPQSVRRRSDFPSCSRTVGPGLEFAAVGAEEGCRATTTPTFA